ncbi:MAG: SEL1-like repeat protein [Proteobacteria bacterium]|nr:SEL1-like repeat protein [Pseudomonadota bacterium]
MLKKYFKFISLLCLVLVSVTVQAEEIERTKNEILNSAMNGNGKDQSFVGMSYLYGDNGYKKNPEQAKYWLLKAAKNGDPDAYAAVAAFAYATGSASEAEKWIRKSAEKRAKDKKTRNKVNKDYWR